MANEIQDYIADLLRRVEALEKRQGYNGRTPSMGNWHDFPLESNWSNASGYQPVQYAIDNSGIVHIRGVATKSGGSDYMGQLPVGHRPNKQHRLVVSGLTASSAFIEIDENGLVVANDSAGVGTIGMAVALPVNDGLTGNPMPLNVDWYPYYEVGFNDKWGWPYLHKHASGAMLASGTIKGGTETFLEIGAFLDTDQCNEFAHIMRGIGTSNPGDTPSTSRMDASPGKIAYVRGGAADSVSASGWVWISNSYDAVEDEELDLAGAGVFVNYLAPTGSSWHPHPRIVKDKSGWCVLMGIGSNYTLSTGTTFASITSTTMRPPAKLLLPFTSGDDPVTYPVTLDTDGTFTALDTIPGTSFGSFDGLHFHTT